MPLHIDTAAAIRRPADQAALVQAVLRDRFEARLHDAVLRSSTEEP